MSTKSPNFFSAAARCALLLAGGWLALRFLLPWLAPLLAAVAFAAAIEPAVLWLQRKARLPRSAAAGLCVLSCVGILFALLGLLCSRVASELHALMLRLPELLAGLSDNLQLWKLRVCAWLERGGLQTQPVLDHAAAAAVEHLRSLPATLSAKLLSVVASLAAAAPAALLFAVTLVIGAYFASASFPEVIAFLSSQLSDTSRKRAAAVWHGLRTTIVRWIRAQLLMMLFVFLALTLAFSLLRVNYALLLALCTAVIDALPVLGAGTVLIPWALYQLLCANFSLGTGLVIVYIAVTVLRSCVQAKLIGDQLGLHPLAALLAIYLGFASSGVPGMLLFPILLITAKQLNDTGLLHLWNSPPQPEKGNTNVRNRFVHNRRNGHEHSGRHEYPSR